MRLYPDGDPRGAELVRRLSDHRGLDGRGPDETETDRFDVVAQVLDVGRQRGLPPPNVDLGLGALAFCCGMTPGAGQAIATVGRMAGWIAHALEEYASATTFRVRANYVGVRS
jgi:citrate synthase